MRIALLLLILTMPVFGVAQVFRCGEPKGVAIWSSENHKAVPDGYAGVMPVVIIEGKVMTIVWGDAKSGGGTERVWKAVVIHRSEESISGVALDEGPSASASMLYTVDVKRGYLYMSSHKNIKSLNASAVNAFVSKCSR